MSRQYEVLDTQSAYATASRTVSVVSPPWATSAIFYLNLTAVAGTTPIMDAKLQFLDPVAGTALDVDGAAFAQQTAAAFQVLEIGQNLVADATGNHRKANSSLPGKFQVAFTFDRTTANETYTYTLAVEWFSR